MSVPQEAEKPYKPITFTKYVWERCKSQPLIPAGCVATVGALLAASVSLRTGNRQSFNFWLRMRVLAQGATVVAMVVYGSVALTRQQQTTHYIKSQIMLGGAVSTGSPLLTQTGDLPPDTKWPGRKPGEAAPKLIVPEQDDAEAAEKEAREIAANYPLAKKDRMKVSDFAKRLKEAEEIQKEEDDRKEVRKAARAAQAKTAAAAAEEEGESRPATTEKEAVAAEQTTPGDSAAAKDVQGQTKVA